MRDESRECQCGKPHPWGIIRYSDDHVPLYGPHPLPSCENFRPRTEENLPAGIDARELWAETGDLDAQATLATRVVVARLRSLAKGKNSYAAMAAQFPEFMGFVVSQITDLRGTLVRDEAKFSHLVAHTDEIVEAMRGVVQLSERLKMHEVLLSQISERLEDMESNRLEQTQMEEDRAEDEALRHFGLLDYEDDSLRFDPRRFTPSRPEEPVLVEKVRDDDESDQDNGDSDSDSDDDSDEDGSED